MNKTRKLFVQWVRGAGSQYEVHTPGETNYVIPMARGDDKNTAMKAAAHAKRTSNFPFPLNKQFKSHPVLNEDAREMIWSKVMVEGMPIKAVSAELGVDITRVAAVVRLKEVEKDWIAKDKPLAKPYAKAVLEMLPTKTFKPGFQNEPLEPINEVHIHTATMKQLFWPTSESRHFTREDAAKAFHTKMLSTDKRIPHPELVQMERDVLEGDQSEASAWEAKQKFLHATAESEKAAAMKLRNREDERGSRTLRVNKRRFEFRFENYNSEDVGKGGRKIDVVGHKYGKPHYDRVKGFVTIPTSVP